MAVASSSADSAGAVSGISEISFLAASFLSGEIFITLTLATMRKLNNKPTSCTRVELQLHTPTQVSLLMLESSLNDFREHLQQVP